VTGPAAMLKKHANRPPEVVAADGLLQETATGTCGRLTKRGGQCTQSIRPSNPACGAHITSAEKAAYEARLADARRIACAYWVNDSTPACWSWPVLNSDRSAMHQAITGSDDALHQTFCAYDVLWEWQQHRCALCRAATADMVMDHDHETGYIRGWLCRRCNTEEGVGWSERIGKYRKQNPASLFGIDVWYHSEITGWAYPADKPTLPPGAVAAQLGRMFTPDASH
jgi:Recombination endonuclease VII